MPELWSHQVEALDRTYAAIHAGEQRICVCSPTGCGKTLVMTELCKALVERGWTVPIFTHRSLLLQMLRDSLTVAGVPFGIRAAGHPTDPEQPVQVCMVPTERSRTVKQSGSIRWQPHGLEDRERRVCAVWDEAHLMTGPTCRELIDLYCAHKGVNVGLTATPVDLHPVFTHLIEAGCVSSGRDCGALVWADHYAPDEPDLARIKNGKGQAIPLGQDLSEPETVRAMMTPTILGRVLEWLFKINPTLRPTILFAPGKPESLWFAEQLAFPELRRKEDQHYPAISCAHIDGEQVWCNGKSVSTSDEARQKVIDAHQAGAVKILCNRFVMREGVNLPWLEHGILATVFGSIQSYIQAGGRLLRTSSGTGKERVTVQDHGGNFWRHGSLNADRHWDMSETASQIAARRADRFRNPPPGEKPEPQPFSCPQCRRVMHGKKCPSCGWEMPVGGRKSRPVIELDGSLGLREGDAFKPRRKMNDRQKVLRLWEQYYHRATRHKWNPTFLQLEALFAQENNWSYPPVDLPYMPQDRADMLRRVRDVPRDRLIQAQKEGARS